MRVRDIEGLYQRREHETSYIERDERMIEVSYSQAMMSHFVNARVGLVAWLMALARFKINSAAELPMGRRRPRRLSWHRFR